MTEYAAPTNDIRLALMEAGGLEAVRALPGCEDLGMDLVDAILEEAGKLASEVLAPLNRKGDIEGCSFENGVVRSPDGFAEAYKLFCDGGWNGLSLDSAYGGQGLPWLISTAVNEIWQSANMAFALCSMLTQGAAELLSAHASDNLKARYLPPLIAGTWNGTMNLTEPQAGSDLGRVRTRAQPDGDAYRITGQKIFITYGETDFTENTVHMVLARTPDAPPGVRGISLFVVPKFLPGDAAGLGPRNDLRCVSIEHKLGIHASPTALMSFGDGDGAVGFLVGKENHGLEYMFTMMNNERLAVGLQGTAIAERAYQQARAFAMERLQGRAASGGQDEPVPIFRHADVKRMLLTMKAGIEATRGLAYYVAGEMDAATRHASPDRRKSAQARVDLLTPVVKAWATDVCIGLADTGLQIHGGMGYIEETGAAQHLRDARITAIYEGTNGIQAIDLVGRKVARDGGAAMAAMAADMRSTLAAVGGTHADTAAIAGRLDAGIGALERATAWIVETHAGDVDAVLAGAVPYLHLVGVVCGGWIMLRSRLAAKARRAGPGEADAFPDDTWRTARLFAEHSLVHAPAYAETVIHGAGAVTGAPDSGL